MKGFSTTMFGLGLSALAKLTLSHAARAQAPAPAPLQVPARSLPVPTTVSPQMQKIMGAPIGPNWNVVPKSGAEWKASADAGAARAIQNLPALRERLHVRAEASTMDGGKVHIITPDNIPPENRARVLIHIHGGCYVLNPGEAGTTEAIFMAGFGRFKVISVDYRMPPESFFPAALDDVLTVWKAALKNTSPKNMAILGSSAGGALTLALVHRAKQLGLPLPAAIASGTPMADLTKTGDSFHTNAMVDNILASSEGRCDAAAGYYANGHDLRDPLLSPVYGDMHGFPPTILTTGTRDLLLSNTVRVHRKLREAGVEAALQVFEGQAHGAYMRDDTAPESKAAFAEISEFFNRHLGK